MSSAGGVSFGLWCCRRFTIHDTILEREVETLVAGRHFPMAERAAD